MEVAEQSERDEEVEKDRVLNVEQERYERDTKLSSAPNGGRKRGMMNSIAISPRAGHNIGKRPETVTFYE